MTKKILTLKEACLYIGLSKGTMYKLTMNKEIRHYKPNGKLIFFRVSDLDKFMTRHVIEPVI